MCLLFLLHLCIEVADLGLELFNLLASILIKIVYHVLLDLECVALHF